MGLINPSSDKDSAVSTNFDDQTVSSSTSTDMNLPSTESGSDLDKSVQDVLSSANNLASSSILTVKDALSSANDLASAVTSMFPEMTNDIRSSLKDLQESTSESFGSRLPSGFGSIPGSGRFFDFESPLFDSFLKGGYYKTNDDGYIAYPVPSVKLFDECNKIKGLSAWDQKGYWHCLFPKAIIPIDSQALSKEDIEGDSDHKFGYWFQNYNDLLNWQSKMNAVIQEKKKVEWAKFREQEKKKWQFLQDDDYKGKNKGQGQINNDDGWNDSSAIQKHAIKTYSSTFTKSLGNGDTEKTTKIKRRFDDGSREVREIKEIIDQSGASTIVNQDVSTIPPKRGWFWNGKGGEK